MLVYLQNLLKHLDEIVLEIFSHSLVFLILGLP